MKDINLLPEDIRNPQEPVKVERQGVSKVKVVTLIVAILALVGVSLVLPKVYIIMQNTRLDMINENIESEKYNEVKAVNTDIVSIKSEISKKNNIVLDIDSKNILVGQIVSFIGNSVPKGCSLKTIKFTEGSLNVEGYSMDPIQATEFLSYISRIESVMVNNSSVELKDGKYEFKYELTITRKGGK
ncbi:PilN domain-containing protein [Pseudobacteroides cellulosolvens]|uniref:Fimbrial assembly family protein n=1 Tax=Pseudobacteroides cellulosolvens ATCC 35603 = DSM 2933 TaxID=398512 RepID=A0A0L6JR02_9FIRM|nr:hypothetical protein [Pseudobacteroides cellulosolvens]KNY28203.1 hypothetical protein Bccel_3477 [Pseudobacteroides cellulosolvens ATCC 35603 = DSM 2933]